MIQFWADTTNDELTLDNIKKLFVPNERYRISPASYAKGTRTVQTSELKKIFALGGECTYINRETEETFRLIAGQFCDLPQGTYFVTVSEKDDYKCVKVFDLSKVFPELKVR